MLFINEIIDKYIVEYAASSYIDCFLCKILIINKSLRCSIIAKDQVTLWFILSNSKYPI